jgi:hypothetical protein
MRRFLFLLPLVAACKTTVSSAPPNISSAVATLAQPVRAWELRDGESLIGCVVRLEVSGDPERAWFSVRNAHQQEMGIIDLHGRFWRYRPHQRELDWLGSGTVLQAARSILDSGEGAELVELNLEALPK